MVNSDLVARYPDGPHIEISTKIAAIIEWTILKHTTGLGDRVNFFSVRRIAH